MLARTVGLATVRIIDLPADTVIAVRVASKELTSLLLDEERLKAERTDRKSWKSRVGGLEENGGPSLHDRSPRRHRTRPANDEEDEEYRLALEASKYQEEEDRKKRESRGTVNPDDDDDLAKAIKLSKEEEERRRRELEDSNATSLFDTDPTPTQPTGYNQGYQQGSAVDFFANPIDQNQMQMQPTGYMASAYTGFQTQPTGYPNGYTNGFGAQPTGYDMYGQQNMQQQQNFQPQPTGFNPYAQQQIQSPVQQEPAPQPGSHNPWATTQQPQQQSLKPMPTGSNNPFAQQQSATKPQPFKAPPMPSLSSLPEQKTLSSFNQPSFGTAQPVSQPQQQQQPQHELSEHEQRLNALLASGDGMDTFGNTGNLRIPAQHTAPGTFVNSAGAGLNRMTADATGNNPFLRQQFTGMPTVSYGGQQMPAATGPAGMNGGQGTNNPFAARQQQQQGNQGGDLIQF